MVYEKSHIIQVENENVGLKGGGGGGAQTYHCPPIKKWGGGGTLFGLEGQWYVAEIIKWWRLSITAYIPGCVHSTVQ